MALIPTFSSEEDKRKLNGALGEIPGPPEPTPAKQTKQTTTVEKQEQPVAEQSGVTRPTPVANPKEHIGLSEPAPMSVPSQFSMGMEIDEFEDPELVPPALFNTPAQDYWGTATPAEPQEKQLFESQPFQQAALTFGLSLLLGNNPEDALMNGMQSYAQAEYVNTDEYAELANMGIPQNVIKQGFTSGDWTQVKKWEADMQERKFLQQKMDIQKQQFGQQMTMDTWKTQVQMNQFDRKYALESDIAQQNVQKNTLAMLESMKGSGKGSSKLYESYAKDIKTIGQDASKYRRAMEEYDANKDKYTPMEQLGLVYKTAKINDPDSAVREAELNLIFEAVPSVRAVMHKIGKNASLSHLEDVLPGGAAKDLAAYLNQRNKDLLNEKVTQMLDLDQQVAKMGYTTAMERPWYEVHNLNQFAGNKYGVTLK